MEPQAQRSQTITPRQVKFVKNLSKGMTQREAAIKAGYSNTNTHTLMSRMLRNEALIKLMDMNGLTDINLVRGIKTNIETGIGVKSTADTATKNIELAFKLKGYLDKDPDNNNTNVNVNVELRSNTKQELIDKLNSIDGELTTIDK